MLNSKIKLKKRTFNVLNKSEQIQADKKFVFYKLFGKIKVLSKEVTYTKRKTYFLGFCVSTKKIINDIEKNKTDLEILFKTNGSYCNQEFWLKLIECKSLTSTLIMWFDHTSGGGTEVYTLNRIAELKNRALFVRVQNNASDAYLITYYYKNICNNILLNCYEDLERLVYGLNPTEIVINNLASYRNSLSILSLVEKFKKTNVCRVVFMGHDFQCICPTITMVNYKNSFCNSSDWNNCAECIKKYKKLPINVSSLTDYQNSYSFFINNIVDRIIVFSKSTKNIYLTFYPKIEAKIDIIPHDITPLKQVNVEKHNGINIAVLGNITIPKGAEVLEKIDNILQKHKNIYMYLFGQCIKKLKHIKQKGVYNIKNLPEIMEENNIDLVFIPSICPETFSYVASEAIEMGLPIACFNIGAPVEKIISSKQGIVISEINEEKALKEISTYIKDRQGI